MSQGGRSSSTLATGGLETRQTRLEILNLRGDLLDVVGEVTHERVQDLDAATLLLRLRGGLLVRLVEQVCGGGGSGVIVVTCITNTKRYIAEGRRADNRVDRSERRQLVVASPDIRTRACKAWKRWCEVGGGKVKQQDVHVLCSTAAAGPDAATNLDADAAGLSSPSSMSSSAMPAMSSSAGLLQ
jgi:hypothetical protein